MQRECVQCNKQFTISDEALAYYKRISPTFAGQLFEIPPPTRCPSCRQRRRFTFRNERNLYRRTCAGSGKEIISMYHPDSPYRIYAQDVWWSDNWDAKDYGRDYDFSKSFTEQFIALQKEVPRAGLLNNHCENSDYCNFTGDVKNSYLIFGSVYSEDCYYGSPYYSKNCVDTLVLRDCELCYECIDCRNLYNCKYCQDCSHSNDLLFCFDLKGCSECIGCVGLRNKKFHIFNQPYSEEEYYKYKNSLDLCNSEHRTMLANQLEDLKRTTPLLAAITHNSENVSGSHIFNSKNTQESFFADRCEDCAFCAQVVDLKDCYDNNYTEENEMCYEYLGMYKTQQTFFSIFCRQTANIFYSEHCVNCQDLFGCTNMRNARYCILNKQYTKEEYEKTVAKIITQMQAEGTWGEFSAEHSSPYAYNESVAQEYFPLSEAQAQSQGLAWRTTDEREFQPQRIQIPDDIAQVPDSICYEVLACEITGRNYRIIPQELAFYRQMKLPIPRRHPNERHAQRIAKRNPRVLNQRACAQCHTMVQTTYPPNTPYTIVCEKCYLATH